MLSGLAACLAGKMIDDRGLSSAQTLTGALARVHGQSTWQAQPGVKKPNLQARCLQQNAVLLLLQTSTYRPLPGSQTIVRLRVQLAGQ